jgi:hypothetical protein
MEPVSLYRQNATHFSLRFVIDGNQTLDGRVVLELADTFVDRLVFPGCALVSLWTKSPGMVARLNTGDYSDRRWKAARKKISANDSAVLRLEARTRDFPNQSIALSVQANPPGGQEHLDCGTLEVTCSIPYLRHLAASSDTIDTLLAFGTMAWNAALPVYGFSNLAIRPKRPGPSFAEGGPPHLDIVAPPATRVHPIPVAQTGNDIDLNIDGLICRGHGIKGAYWANYLSAAYVDLAGGEAMLRDRLTGLRVEPVRDGLLIVATDSPMPNDSEENRQRFVRLEAALRPAFLSRADTPPNKRELLGYFYRESDGTTVEPAG